MSVQVSTKNGSGRPQPKFSLGALVMTPGIQNMMEKHDLNPLYFVGCHLTGIWGDIDQVDRASNDEALEKGGRLFSAYDVLDPSVRIWIITEADISCTTVLLPEEY